MTEKVLEAASDKKADADFKIFENELKSKNKDLFKKRGSLDVLADNYYTARGGGATDKEARVFATKLLEGYSKIPPGKLDTAADIEPGLKKQAKKYLRVIKNKLKERSKRKDEDLSTDLEASESKPYTNKSKSVKVIYYSNRSTPQVAKPGQTVHAKKGYGKRTKIRSATPDEVKQFKQGKWLRTREDGKKATDSGSKTSKYRPQLAKKQRDARKRKMAASDTPKNRYMAFIEEVFGQ